MKLLVFSDIHGNSYALESFGDYISGLMYDKIIFLGDIFGYYYEQEKCLKLIHRIPNLIWLKGNHDEYATQVYYGRRDEDELIQVYGHSYAMLNERFNASEIDFICSLPSSCILWDGNKKIGFFHGRPRNPLEGRFYNDTEGSDKEFGYYDMVILGHTHCRIDRFIGNTHIISPGSLGQPRDGKGYGFAIIDTVSEKVDFYDIKVNNDILKKEIDKNDPGLKKLYDVLARERKI